MATEHNYARKSIKHIQIFIPVASEERVNELKNLAAMVATAACLFVCLVSLRPRQQLGYSADRSQDWRLTILRAATHKTERGEHDFCLSRHIRLTLPQPVGNGRPQHGLNPGLPHSTYNFLMVCNLARLTSFQYKLNMCSQWHTANAKQGVHWNLCSTYCCKQAQPEGSKAAIMSKAGT